MEYSERLSRLHEQLSSFESLAIAFSGGVDSSVLLHASKRALGERAVGVIADSASLPRAELHGAQRVARKIGIRLEVLRTDELEVQGYRENLGLRCYWCRHTLFSVMQTWAQVQGFSALAYGEIMDDLGDVRPGRKAAAEFGVVAPLVHAAMYKTDVRRYAEEQGLPVAQKPASACLASRLPMGTEVTRKGLKRIEEAEEALRELGFRVLRVRDYGRRARFEVGPDELAQARKLEQRVGGLLRGFGFESFELATYGRPELVEGPSWWKARASARPELAQGPS